MWIVGLVIVIGVAIYFVFLAADGLALTNQTASATVVGKGFREAGRSYYTEFINGRPVAAPRVTPEQYLLKFVLEGRDVECPVSLVMHNTAKAGDHVNVTYQRRRLTGAFRIVNVSR
jgi:hypothetical protein